MAPDGSKRSQVSAAPPPRTLNVQKFAESRAAELETLHSIVANRLNNDFRSQRNKRRRTTGHNNKAANNRRRKRQKLGVLDQSNELGSEKEQKKVPRHIRRRIELKKNPENGFCTSGDGTKRLRTHVWHAKRFTMTKLWGFHLPLGLQGRGRGSRALLKRFKHGALMHDASYYVAIQLEGPEDSLLSILSMVLVPSPSAQSDDNSHSILSGDIYGSTMLHHVGSPVSQSIAPVTYMWRPFHKVKDHNADGCNESQGIECCHSFRQLWVWIHASAFNEGYDALKLACQKEMDERSILVNCFSLEGKLAKLELMGLKAFQLLHKILQPITCISENSWQLKKHSVAETDDSSQFKKYSLPENEQIFSNAILHLHVKDPRTLSEKRIGDALESTSTSKFGDVHEKKAKKHPAITDIPDKNEKIPLSLWSKTEGNSIRSDMDLWDAKSRVSPPVEENVLCMEKHHLRMDFFCHDDPNSGILDTSSKVQCSKYCPILLLKNNNQKGSLIRWSVILPLSWVRAFWIPLISVGAQAIGLREKHWIACEVGLPYFPSDFPDSDAYSRFMENEAVASNEKIELRPPAVRPLRVPIPPPWDSVRVAVDKGLTRVADVQISSEKDVVNVNPLSNSSCGNCDMASFGGTVARTSTVLTRFLNEIHGEHLPLFPQVSDRNTSISKFLKDESKLSQGQNGINQINYDNKLCFLRVVLHACKEGAFEEGAVVCAPHLTDILSQSSRSENNEGGLQVSQSSMKLYFKEKSSGNWELQMPEDPVARESHRLPIGFVTTGFVRGSKKPVAEAFCEAVLLARLREEQWNEMPAKRRKKEIYVLVRNLRSSVYRLALATIVLEQQEADVEFM